MGGREGTMSQDFPRELNEAIFRDFTVLHEKGGEEEEEERKEEEFHY